MAAPAVGKFEAVIQRKQEELIVRLNSVGWRLLSPYGHSGTEVLLQCRQGHQFQLKPNDVRDAYKVGKLGCRMCGEEFSRKKSTAEVPPITTHDLSLMSKSQLNYYRELVDFCTARGWKVMSNYGGDNVKMQFLCANDHPRTITPSNFKLHYKEGTAGCAVCSNNDPEAAKQKCMETLTAHGVTLEPGQKYERAATGIRCRCRNGHLIDVVWADVNNTGRVACLECRGLDLDSILGKVKARLADKQLVCLDLGMYENDKTSLTVQHICGNVFATTYAALRDRATACRACHGSTGEKHVMKALQVLGIEYKTEHRITEDDLRRYDFLIQVGGRAILIEFDGDQHFQECSMFHVNGKTVETEHENDRQKTKRALDMGYFVIRVDSSYAKERVGRLIDLLRKAFDLFEYHRVPLFCSQPGLYHWLNLPQSPHNFGCFIGKPILPDGPNWGLFHSCRQSLYTYEIFPGNQNLKDPDYLEWVEKVKELMTQDNRPSAHTFNKNQAVAAAPKIGVIKETQKGKCARELQERISPVGWQLLSPYVTADREVRMRCSNGHLFSHTPAAIQSASKKGVLGCMDCGQKFTDKSLTGQIPKVHDVSQMNTRQSKHYQEIMELCAKKGWTVDSNYTTAKDYMWFLCNQGHSVNIYPTNFKKSTEDPDKGCRFCSGRGPNPDVLPTSASPKSRFVIV